MSARSTLSTPPAWPLRLAALACLGLILLLSWLAVDPAAHAALHAGRAEAGAAAHDHADCNHGHDHGPVPPTTDDSLCVITTFLSGATDLFWVALLLLLCARLLPAEKLVAIHRDIARSVLGRATPSCGPPRLA